MSLNSTSVPELVQAVERTGSPIPQTHPNPLVDLMRDQKVWHTWIKGTGKDGKPTKIPVKIDAGFALPFNATDIGKLDTYDVVASQESHAARLGLDGVGGLGISIRHLPNIEMVDLDHCVSDGVITNPRIAAFVDAANTYAELSPSGTGIHLALCVMDGKPKTGFKRHIDDAVRDDVQIQTNCTYYTFTGKIFRNLPVRSVTKEELAGLYAIVGITPEAAAPSAPQPQQDKLPPTSPTLDDAELLKRMFAAKNGKKIKALYEGDTSAHDGDDSAADLAFCSHLAFWTGKNEDQMDRIFRSSKLMRPKWDGKRGDSTYGKEAIKKAIAVCKEVYKGDGGGVSKGDSTRPTQSTQLVELVMSNPGITLFLDQYKVAHARFPRGGHFEIWPCDSSEFTYWLSDAYYLATGGNAAGAQGIAGALNVLEGRARAGGIRHTLHNRMASHDEAIWYDLADEAWRAVRIDKDGWRVVSDPPILFRRHTYHDAQVDPVGGGDVRDVLEFVNVKDKDQQLLFLVHLIASIIPGFPHAVLYIHGPQGSAKSSLLEVAHALVDPSQIGAMSMPRNIEELKLILDHHSAFACFDNVSFIDEETSDLLCRVVTGAGFSKRSLYTNGEDVICKVQANVAINGINLAAVKPDLLERSVLMELSRVATDEYQEAKPLWEKFLATRPQIFGALLDVVVDAINIKPTISTQGRYRMADYVAWGCAIAEALGETQEAFLAAYQQNVDEQNESVLESNDVATLLQEFMENRNRWEGTATELLGEMRKLGEPRMIEAKDLPRNGAALSRKLKMLKPALEAAGLAWSKDRSTNRNISIRKVSRNAVESVNPVESVPADTGDHGEAYTPSLGLGTPESV